MTIGSLRRFAISRSLFPETTLPRALERMGFVQADPIRAPARAQDLTLRHRVKGHRAGDLERRYADLAIEEDFFVNYGFLPRRHLSLMLPRPSWRTWDATRRRRAKKLIALLEEHGELHPRQAEAALGLGRVTNYWGGSSNATTSLLDDLQYRGLVRVARRESGVRVYALRAVEPIDASRAARTDALLDIAVSLYAPMDSRSLGALASRIRWGAPHLSSEIGPAVARAKKRLARETGDGAEWYWPEGEPLLADEAPERVRLLAPFDPVVWDRRRFHAFFGWEYRFEAYTPAKKRKLGYYALPLLWRDGVIGWANVAANGDAALGWVSGRAPRERAFARELDAELARVRAFLAAD